MNNRDCFENALSCMEKECPAPCRMILDNVADGIVTVDKEGSVAWFNRAAEQITGFSKEEVLGKPCRSVLQTDLCGTDACPLEQTLRHHRNVANLEVVITNKWGRQIPVSVSTAPIKDKEGRILGAVETFRDLSVIKAYQLEAEERYSFKNIVTNNTRMLSILHHLRDLALSDSPVLLSGESGTGKELLARAIHELSRRKEGPYIAVNCGAIPDTLIESELFGYRRGAFTDARQHKPGRFALAERGTLFLDEIGDLPLETQVKLLRVLEGGGIPAPGQHGDAQCKCQGHHRHEQGAVRTNQEGAFPRGSILSNQRGPDRCPSPQTEAGRRFRQGTGSPARPGRICPACAAWHP